MFDSKKKKERDIAKQKELIENYNDKKFERKKIIWDLALAIIWTLILIMNIRNDADTIIIILDAVCAVCWSLSAVLGFINYRKQK